MRDDLQKRLYAKYPLMFVHRTSTPQTSPMFWGITVGDGWYDLIDVLCANIQNHYDNQTRNYQTKSRYDVSVTEPIQVRVIQIKEKFGGLRFYVDRADDYVYGLIALTEAMSYRVCEQCGNPGKPTRGGWVRTLCRDHMTPEQIAEVSTEQQYTIFDLLYDHNTKE